MWKKLKALFRRKSEIRPVMGGPIQPDSVERESFWGKVKKLLRG